METAKFVGIVTDARYSMRPPSDKRNGKSARRDRRREITLVVRSLDESNNLFNEWGGVL
jgi:hypothetical protein